MNKILKLAIFDFDGTLVNSPTPETGGKEIYKKNTGKEWPHIGWFSKPESLDIEAFDITINDAVVSNYKHEASQPNTATVMLTGRLIRLAGDVVNVLNNHNLKFDEYRYNSHGGTTESAKVKSMEELLALDRYKDVRVIDFTDDRVPHREYFEGWGIEMVKSGRLDEFNYILVPGWNENNK